METIYLQDAIEILRHRVDWFENLLAERSILDTDLFHFVYEELVRMAGDLRFLEHEVMGDEEAGEDEGDFEPSPEDADEE